MSLFSSVINVELEKNKTLHNLR